VDAIFEYIWFPDPGDIEDVPCTLSSVLIPDLICAWYTIAHVTLGTKSCLFNYCIWYEGNTNA